jgi:cell wall assembly regulator SMI1
MSIEQDFGQLKKLLKGQDGRAQVFNPPATADDFEELRRVTGVSVRGGLRTLWSLANGAETDAPAFDAWVEQEDCIIECDFLSISQAIELWQMAHDFEGGGRGTRSDKVKPGWFRKRWIPFASFNISSTVIYYDADPSPTGTNGQILVYDDDPPFVHWHSRSLGAFLKQAVRLQLDA